MKIVTAYNFRWLPNHITNVHQRSTLPRSMIPIILYNIKYAVSHAPLTSNNICIIANKAKDKPSTQGLSS